MKCQDDEDKRCKVWSCCSETLLLIKHLQTVRFHAGVQNIKSTKHLVDSHPPNNDLNGEIVEKAYEKNFF